MPAPFSPDPDDRPPVPPRAADPSTTQHDPTATPLARPPDPEPPTVITARTRPPAPDPRLAGSLAGRHLGHFELIEAVGAGGMAAVLKARDLDLGRVVALKILPPDLAADPENVVRFKQEARAAARLDHDNVARVYYFGEDQGLHFIAFEFVEGDNLRQLMDASGGPIPVPEAVALLLQVTAGLQHAAERGVVHRDIKPSNIIVTPDGRAKIVDMGLARSLDPRAAQLTEAGVTLGTFDYISPEQAHDPRAADVRSDIYSLGCTFYHALTGRPPVPDGTAAAKLEAQRHQTPPDPRELNPAIPADLVAILNRMMAKDPDRRYQDPTHLAAHLRVLARKLGVPVGPLSGTAPAPADAPRPRRRLSAPWAVTALAVSALAVAVLTNAFRGPRPDPTGPGPKGPVAGPVDPGPGDPIPPGPGVAGRQDAADVAELLALLKQGAKHIRLTGKDEYDLVRYRDARDGQPVEAVLAGEDVQLDGTPGQTTVRLGFAPDGKARAKTLTLRGSGDGRGTATVRGVRFILPDVDAEDEEAGLLISGFEKVAVEECTFTTLYRTTQRGPAALAVVLRGGLAALAKCYFAPGCVGLFVDGPGKVTATDCAIGPQNAGLRVGRSTTEAGGETEVALTHCSALLPNGASLVEVADQVPAVVRAGLCLFAGPGAFGPFDRPPALLRQRRTRAPATRYEATKSEGRYLPNGYHQINAYAEGEDTYTFSEAAAAAGRVPVHDVETPLKHPWADPDPFDLLESPKDQRDPADARRAAKAFAPDLKQRALRVEGDPTEVLGARFLGPDPMLPSPLPPPESEPRDPTIKVWDPSLPEAAEDLEPGVYPTLDRVLAAARKGDTILIRHTGRLEVDPKEFSKPDVFLTFKPDRNHKPILMPAASVLKRADGLFKLFGGASSKLVFDGLHFRLPAGRAPAVAVLPGGGQLEIRNGVITMEEGEDLAAVTLTDPRGEMMMMGGAGPERWPVPKVTFENVFVRGKGHLLAVKGSRPFELEVKNALAALDAAAIDIEPSTADPSGAGSGVVRLSRVTAYLGAGLVQVRGADRKQDTAPFGLARTEVNASHCLFVPAAGEAEPLVRTERLADREQVDRWFGWRGEENVYGYDRKKGLLEYRPSDAMSPVRLGGEEWLTLSAEKGDPFAAVAFPGRSGLPEAGAGKKFVLARPGQFRRTRFDPPRPMGAPEVGAPADVPGPHE